MACLMKICSAQDEGKQDMQRNLLKNKMKLWKTSKGKAHNMAGADFMLESHKATKSHCILSSFLPHTPFLLLK